VRVIYPCYVCIRVLSTVMLNKKFKCKHWQESKDANCLLKKAYINEMYRAARSWIKLKGLF